MIVDKKMEIDTLEGIVGHPPAWIQAYFHGKRATARQVPMDKVTHGA